MKMNFKEERDKDFYSAFENARKSFGRQAPYVLRSELVRRALYSGGYRYYVTYDEARRNVSRLFREKSLRCRNPLKREMYYHLCGEMRSYLNAHPTAPFNDALFTILSERRAPRFYMRLDTAQQLLYKLEKKLKGDRG